MVILSHALYLSNVTNETVIAIKIHQPEKREKDWSCRYEIDWPEGARVFEAIGFDALQALVLALQMIGAEIYSSAIIAKDVCGPTITKWATAFLLPLRCAICWSASTRLRCSGSRIRSQRFSHRR